MDQEELKRKILALQAEYATKGGDLSELAAGTGSFASVSSAPHLSTPKKRKELDGKGNNEDGAVLAVATPSPKKRKRGEEPDAFHPQRSASTLIQRTAAPRQPGSMNLTRQSSTSARIPTASTPASSRLRSENAHIIQSDPKPSTLVSKMAGLASKSRPSNVDEPAVVRSKGFSDKPAESTSSLPEKTGLDRDDRLVLIERLEMGPADHTPPSDDPNFEKLEPNSGIALSSRQLSHEDFQDYLRGRYFVPPSLLYSVVRLQPNKSGYDVPVDADWLTVGVIAERGPMRYTAGSSAGGGGNDEGPEIEQAENKDSKKGSSTSTRPGGKKYVNIKLIDFGARSSGSRNQKATIRGDAFLSLLLFESDSFEILKEKDDEGKVRATKIYKGGSGGAFEELAKMKEGSVIALLNPKILKPYQRAQEAPHPTSNILAVTPDSAASIAYIGRARDLGMCTVQKRDGTVCGAWCDKRVSENVCEWHVLNAVQSRRAGRAEFSLGTSGLQVSSGPKNQKHKGGYDPARQWGLKPDPSSAGSSHGGSTYVFSGHVISGSAKDMHVHEKIGREAQGKAKRKLDEHEQDRKLQRLLRGDKDGARALGRAKKAMEKLRSRAQESDIRISKASGSTAKRVPSDHSATKAKDGEKGKTAENSSSSSDDEDVEEDENRPSHQYSPWTIKGLGFDPTRKAGAASRKPKDKSQAQKTLDILASLQDSKREIKLGHRPGPKVRSGIVIPSRKDTGATNGNSDVDNDDGMKNLAQKRALSNDIKDSSDLEIEPVAP